MARIRTIKPGFFRHEALFEAEKETGLPLRVAFAGLWTACDREGRFEWKPRQLKLDALPYDEVDFSRVLDALATRGFIQKYRVDGIDYGFVPSWSRHQVVNNREATTEIPEATEDSISAALTREPRVLDAPVTRHDNYPVEQEGKGREQEGKGTDIVVAHAPTPPVKVSHETPNDPPPPEPLFPNSEDLHLAIQHWNFQAPQFGLAQVKDFTDKRRRALKSRLVKLRTLDAWIALVDSLEHRPFCRGENQRGWRIDFDFLIGEGGFTKICEGNWLKPGMSVELEAAHASG